MDEKKIYPMCYNKKHYVVLANDIIKGKQEMTLQQARIIRLLVTQVVKEDKDLKTYTCRIQELADFLKIPSQNLYRDVRQLCDDLIGLKIRVGTGNPKEPWKIFSWVQLAQYDSNGNITLMLSNQVAPFVLELNEKFTQYPQENILEMQSYYAIRLYELLKCEDGLKPYQDIFEFSIAELREYFCCENKLKQFGQFREKVIQTAIKEINDKTDLRVSVKFEKERSRSFNKAIFEVHYQTRKQLDGQTSLNGADASE